MHSSKTPSPEDSTPLCSVTRESASFSHSSVGNYYNVPNIEKHVTKGQDAVNGQRNAGTLAMETEKSSSDKLSCFKDKAAVSGIKVVEDTGSVGNKEEHTIETHVVVNNDIEPKQPAEELVQSPQTAMDATDSAVRNECSDTHIEHALGTCGKALAEANPEFVQLGSEQDVEVKLEEEACVGEKSDSKSKVENQEELALTLGMEEEAEVKDNNKVNACDKGTTMESTVKTEHVMVSLKEDAKILAFEEIARQKGIKVGSASASKTFPVMSPSAEEVSRNVEVENLDILNFAEEDAQIARFEETAWLYGIKVGRDNSRSRSDSESIESVATDYVQESECWTGTYPFEEDVQISRIQEIARLKGIKITPSSSGRWSNNSSHSSFSPATSDDYLCHCGDETCPMTTQRKGDIFEKLAKRNGIKIGKPIVPTDNLNLAGGSAENSQVPLDGNATSSSDNTATSVKPLILSQAGTQTEVTTVDCHSQTCEKDLGLSKQSTGVQVDVVKEAFEEEFLMWKLDENAAGDDLDMCYKELYFKERKKREELNESLQNEKDVSANTKHNHKRVMEQLKEELSSKTEETEVLTCLPGPQN